MKKFHQKKNCVKCFLLIFYFRIWENIFFFEYSIYISIYHWSIWMQLKITWWLSKKRAMQSQVVTNSLRHLHSVEMQNQGHAFAYWQENIDRQMHLNFNNDVIEYSMEEWLSQYIYIFACISLSLCVCFFGFGRAFGCHYCCLKRLSWSSVGWLRFLFHLVLSVSAA